MAWLCSSSAPVPLSSSRTPALDELGLIGALREHAASHSTPDGLRISVEAPEELPLPPAAVEVAAYRIALEALTNVERHAHAQKCVVRFTLNDALQVEITDDGEGLPMAYQAGVGLTSLPLQPERTHPGNPDSTAR